MTTINANAVAKLAGIMKKAGAAVTAKLDSEMNDAIAAVLEQAVIGNTDDYSVDGAIAFTSRKVKLSKGSIGAYTLAAPTTDMEGQEMIITSTSAYAHVVTATGLVNDGVTGGAKNTMTFGAFVGASIHLIAIGQKWSVVSKNVVTIA